MRSLAICLPLLLCSCVVEFHGKERSFEMGLPKPPTNAVVAIPYRKIGIIAGQNPATQQPSVTIGFESGAYYRVPPGFNMWSTITTTHEGFKTTIIDSFVVMKTNAP